MHKVIPPFELDELAIKKAIAFGSVVAISAMESGQLIADDTEADNVEEIVVTATKRESKIEDLPMSVQAITGSRLDNAGVNDFMDYAELIPSLSYIQYGPGRSAFYIRGTSDGNFGNLAGPNTTVAMYLDESPINTVGLNPDLHIYDMERIEVLNGPQGTLYGSSAQGGTVKLITNKPQREEFEAGFEVDASGGKEAANSDSFEGFINIPLSDSLAARVSAYSVNEGGFIDLVGGTKTFSASNYSVPLLGESNHNESTVEGYRASFKAWINDNLTATLTHINQESKTIGSWDHQPDTLGDLKSSKVIGEFTDDEWNQTSLTLEGSFNDTSFTYAGTFFDRDVRYLWDYNDYVEYYNLDSPATNGFGYNSYYTCDYYSYYYYGTFEGACNDPTMWADYSLDMERETHELRFNGGEEGDRLQWLIGVFYDKLENPYKYTYKWPGMQSYYSDGTWNGTGIAGREGIWWEADNLREDETKAIYGEMTYALTDKTAITVGLRSFDSELHFDAQDGYFGGFGTAFYGHEADRIEKDSGISPKVALAHHLDNGGLLYLNYSQGYRPAGTNRTNKNSDAAPLYYDSDELNNYEIGYKYTNADGTLRFNSAYYLMNWEDMQTAVYDRNLATIQFNTNIGDAVIQGIETDLTLLTENGFTIIAGATFTNPELDDNFILSGVIQATPGTQLANVSKHKLSLAINKEFQIASGREGYWDLSLSRTGKRKSSLTNPIDQGAYTLGNFSVALEGDKWAGVLYVDNFFDTRAVIWEYSGYRPETKFTNRPREVGLRLKYKF
ncbi:MAG TPA: TonB-dependent receptor [Gammaproteobacteria bacterium]|nr:TonB-dependent receptor [Gammaproteobacteria bacterium]